ncbi:DUF4326 domain-containing protein [Polymorphospora sp. NPDC050346]|uniref:DUF4326 domain-containing protein n=1 Tax=Polymorphospora sp. NPDC050346 TaxID=3155780 RepID=UPI0034060F4B
MTAPTRPRLISYCARCSRPASVVVRAGTPDSGNYRATITCPVHLRDARRWASVVGQPYTGPAPHTAPQLTLFDLPADLPAGPVRIQRQRTRGWRMPDTARYVGRPGPFGNPFKATPTPTGRATAVKKFGAWLATQPDLIASARRDLAGYDLACWCPLDQPCHADVYLELLRADPTEVN